MDLVESGFLPALTATFPATRIIPSLHFPACLFDRFSDPSFQINRPLFIFTYIAADRVQNFCWFLSLLVPSYTVADHDQLKKVHAAFSSFTRL